MCILCIGLWAIVLEMYVPPWEVYVALPPYRILDPEKPPANPNFIIHRYSAIWNPPNEGLAQHVDVEFYWGQIIATSFVTACLLAVFAKKPMQSVAIPPPPLPA
jgi:hypothetical protein